jgi:hypothetical protein
MPPGEQPDPQELLDRSNERDTYERRILAAERAAFDRGRVDGWWRGVEHTRTAIAQEDAAAWQQVADPVVHPGPARDLVEERRWGPGGRQHFADPRPGDFPGRDHKPAEPEPEQELEAG